MDFEKKVRSNAYNTKLPYGPTAAEKEAHTKDDDDLNEKFMADAKAYCIEQGVPEKYVAKVVNLAWQDGHSSGYSEVLNCLYGLIGIFN